MSLAYKFKNPDGIYFITFSVVGWIDVFTRDIYRGIFVDSLNWSIKNKGLKVHAWVLMTNHVHLIVSRQGAHKLEEIFRDLKKFTAINIIDEIKNNPNESRKKWMLRLFNEKGLENTQNEKNQFWQHGNHPIELDSNEIIDQKIEYIHNNPLAHGFSNNAESYNWSSAMDYAGIKGFVEISKLD